MIAGGALRLSAGKGAICVAERGEHGDAVSRDGVARHGQFFFYLLLLLAGRSSHFHILPTTHMIDNQVY